MVEKALSDLRIIDLTQAIAGPYCTKWFADFGAEVIKVEKPGVGDAAREMGPFLGDIPGSERSVLFLYLNTNKKSYGRMLAKEQALKEEIERWFAEAERQDKEEDEVYGPDDDGFSLPPDLRETQKRLDTIRRASVVSPLIREWGREGRLPEGFSPVEGWRARWR